MLSKLGVGFIGCRWETPPSALLNITSYGDAYEQTYDTGGRRFTAEFRARGPAAAVAYGMLHRRLEGKGYEYKANKVGIFAYTTDMRARPSFSYHTEVEWEVSFSYNVHSMKYFTAGGIAHYIYPAFPWAERRLTYKRTRGWSFPHRPYWIVARERRDEYARLAAEEEGVCNGEWYDGYDEA